MLRGKPTIQGCESPCAKIDALADLVSESLIKPSRDMLTDPLLDALAGGIIVIDIDIGALSCIVNIGMWGLVMLAGTVANTIGLTSVRSPVDSVIGMSMGPLDGALPN